MSAERVDGVDYRCEGCGRAYEPEASVYRFCNKCDHEICVACEALHDDPNHEIC